MTTTHLEQDNIARVRLGFEAFARADMAKLKETFHTDASWHIAPCGVLAGHYQGRDAILAFFGQLAQETNGTFRSVPDAIAAEKDRVFVECTLSGMRHGKSVTLKTVLVFTIVDGLAKNVDDYPFDFREAEAFWS
ncbi:MAG: nuclear transport factor 2 family protein [Vulcanimicrobiaceae bacterium]